MVSRDALWVTPLNLLSLPSVLHSFCVLGRRRRDKGCGGRLELGGKKKIRRVEMMAEFEGEQVFRIGGPAGMEVFG